MAMGWISRHKEVLTLTIATMAFMVSLLSLIYPMIPKEEFRLFVDQVNRVNIDPAGSQTLQLQVSTILVNSGNTSNTLLKLGAELFLDETDVEICNSERTESQVRYRVDANVAPIILRGGDAHVLSYTTQPLRLEQLEGHSTAALCLFSESISEDGDIAANWYYLGTMTISQGNRGLYISSSSYIHTYLELI